MLLFSEQVNIYNFRLSVLIIKIDDCIPSQHADLTVLFKSLKLLNCKNRIFSLIAVIAVNGYLRNRRVVIRNGFQKRLELFDYLSACSRCN